MAKTPEVIKVEIVRCRVELDPSIDVFNVTLTSGNGEWQETFGTEGELRAFLRGAEASGSFSGLRLGRYEIPREHTTFAVPQPDEA